MLPTTKKRRTKIVRRRAGAKPNMYFNEDTARAIEAYQASTDAVQKEKLYVAEIFPAFDKLVENLIFIHGFRGLHDSYDDLKNDCVTFLYEAINKFDPKRGTKPFSYFNVVAKHWLIIRSKQRVNKMKKSLSIDDEGLNRADRDAIEGHYILPAQDDQLEGVEFVVNVHRLLDEIRGRVTNENELKCIDAVIQLFKAVDDRGERPGEDLLLNKRAVFMFLRELSALSPKQLTSAVSSVKRHYRELRDDEEHGIY